MDCSYFQAGQGRGSICPASLEEPQSNSKRVEQDPTGNRLLPAAKAKRGALKGGADLKEGAFSR